MIKTIFEAELGVKVAILIGSLCLLFGGFYFLFYQAELTELTQLEEDIDGPNGLKSKISLKRGIVRNLGEYKEKVRILDVELKKALEELPDEREMDVLLSKIADKARDSGLEIKLFRPGDEKKHEFYASVPVQVEVLGTYHQIASFFDEVGHMDRIVNLGDITLKNPNSNLTKKGAIRGISMSQDKVKVVLESTVVSTAFRFLDENERPKKDKAEKRRRRKRRS